MNSSTKLSRRLLLQGLGVSVALPWLESARAMARGPDTPSPKRFACLFIGDGISPPNWWSKGDGAVMELGPSLKSLERYKDKLNVVNGLGAVAGCRLQGPGAARSAPDDRSRVERLKCLV